MDGSGVVVEGDGRNGWILDTLQFEPVMHEAASLLNAATYDFEWTAANDIYRHVLHYHIASFDKATA